MCDVSGGQPESNPARLPRYAARLTFGLPVRVGAVLSAFPQNTPSVQPVASKMLTMPKLKNAKHEAYCQARIAGANAAESYLGAGFNSKDKRSAAAGASRLEGNNALIKDRIAELREELAKKVIEKVIDTGAQVAVMERQMLSLTDLVNKSKRIEMATLRYQALMHVLRERAKNPLLRQAPGGDGGETGLGTQLIEFKLVKTPNQPDRQVPHFYTDTATLRELANIERGIAEELGQIGNDEGNAPLTVTVITCDADR